jgi:putative transposase
MKLIPNNFYHIYNRGNNKGRIFFSDENYIFFLKKIKEYLSIQCDIICYCLMPNHFHFLIHIPENFDSENFTNGLKICLRSYTRAINYQEGRSGSLFQQHTKFKCLSENNNKSLGYALTCFNYIHQNPLISGLVDKIEDWKYSSFRDYAGLRNGKLCKKELAYELLGISNNYQEFYKLSYEMIDEDKIKEIL